MPRTRAQRPIPYRRRKRRRPATARGLALAARVWLRAAAVVAIVNWFCVVHFRRKPLTTVATFSRLCSACNKFKYPTMRTNDDYKLLRLWPISPGRRRRRPAAATASGNTGSTTNFGHYANIFIQSGRHISSWKINMMQTRRGTALSRVVASDISIFCSSLLSLVPLRL